MTKIGNFLGSFLLIFLFAFSAAAANSPVNVQAMVDSNEVPLGENVTLSVTVSSSDSVDIQEPRVSDLDGFSLLNSQQSTAVSQKLVQTDHGMQFQTQRRREFTYLLSPQREGQLSIAAIEVVVDGKVYHTQPILVKVTKAGAQTNRRGRPQANQLPSGIPDPFEQMDQAEEEIFNHLLQQRAAMLQQQGAGAPGEDGGPGPGAQMAHPAYRSMPTNPNEAFFVQVEVDKTEVYEGEQITVNWYIYTRGQMETLDRDKFPDLKGFWKETIEEVPSIQFTQEVINGVPYKKALLASHALFPIKAGTAVIDEYKIKSRIRLPVDGYGYLGPAYEYTKSSKPVDIIVKPLPLDGRPADFTGAVGQFDVHAAVEGQSFPVNQPFTLKVRFEGSGNAKVIDLPQMNLPQGLEMYDTKTDSKFFKNGRSYKEFEVLLIPRQEGEMTIPALTASMFNPHSKQYETKSTEPIHLKIVANPNAPTGTSSRMSGNTPAPSGAKEATLPGVIMAWEPSSSASVLSRSWLWAVIFAGVVLGLLMKARYEFGWGLRRRSLKEIVAVRFKKVEAALKAGDYRKVGAEMTNVFYAVLGEMANTGGASIEINRLVEMMPPSVRRDHGDQILKSFDVFQTLSFAPEEMLGSLKGAGTLQTQVDQARKTINAVIATSDNKES